MPSPRHARLPPTSRPTRDIDRRIQERTNTPNAGRRVPGWPGWARRHNTQQRTAESPRPDSTRVGQDRRALRDAHARARQASESKYTYIKRKRRPAELAKGTASTAAGSAASRTAVTCPPLLASPCAHAALPAHRTRATTTYPALPMLDTRGAYCFECHAHTPPTCAGQVRHASRKDPRAFCRRHVSPRTVARRKAGEARA